MKPSLMMRPVILLCSSRLETTFEGRMKVMRVYIEKIHLLSLVDIFTQIRVIY